jgi:voltage-gated potassium channel
VTPSPPRRGPGRGQPPGFAARFRGAGDALIGSSRTRSPLSRLWPPLLLLGALLVYGMLGYVIIEHYPVLDALFMTVITVSTVGYEEVHRLDAAGQVFTISVIVLGVGDFLYSFGILVELLSSGEWQEQRRAHVEERRLHGLRDHVVVCGYGRTGRQAVRELEQAHQPFVVVEWNPQGLENVEADRVLHVLGDASDDAVLERAGIRRARALISAVDSDERNVYIVLTARALSPDLYIVARSSYPDSLDKLRRAGADRVVSPYSLSGRRMAALATQPAVVDTLDLLVGGAEGDIQVEELEAGEHIPPALDAAQLRRSGAVLLALRAGDGRLEVGPGDDTPVHPHDIVVAMGSRDQLTALAAALRPATPRS